MDVDDDAAAAAASDSGAVGASAAGAAETGDDGNHPVSYVVPENDPYGHQFNFYLEDAIDDIPEYLVHFDNFVRFVDYLCFFYKKKVKKNTKKKKFSPSLPLRCFGVFLIVSRLKSFIIPI